MGWTKVVKPSEGSIGWSKVDNLSEGLIGWSKVSLRFHKVWDKTNLYIKPRSKYSLVNKYNKIQNTGINRYNILMNKTSSR